MGNKRKDKNWKERDKKLDEICNLNFTLAFRKRRMIKFFFFQELRLRDRENDFFFEGFIFGGFFFLEVNSPSFGRFQEVNIRFNEFVLS